MIEDKDGYRIEYTVAFTPADVGAVHFAMLEARHLATDMHAGVSQAVAKASAERAEQLKITRNKILDQLPEEFHQHRLAYPDYYAARVSFEEYDRTRNGGQVMKNIANPD